MKKYGKEPLFREAMADCAEGKYIKGVSAFSWRIVIRAAALIFRIRAYTLFVLGIALLRKLGWTRASRNPEIKKRKRKARKTKNRLTAYDRYAKVLNCVRKLTQQQAEYPLSPCGNVLNRRS